MIKKTMIENGSKFKKSHDNLGEEILFQREKTI
jgi:hypothetical protein